MVTVLRYFSIIKSYIFFIKTLNFTIIIFIFIFIFIQATVFVNGQTTSCFFSNKNTSSDAIIKYEDMNIIVPAWSVSIFPDCQTEAYNTAKVNKIYLYT